VNCGGLEWEALGILLAGNLEVGRFAAVGGGWDLGLGSGGLSGQREQCGNGVDASECSHGAVGIQPQRPTRP
jgi:hypothetical protein